MLPRRELRALYAPSTLLCVLCLLLWIRSYWRYDAAGVRVAGNYVGLTSLNGQVRFEWESGAGARPTAWDRRSVRQHLSLWRRELAPGGPLGFDAGAGTGWTAAGAVPAGPWVVVPHWLPALAAVAVPPLASAARAQYHRSRPPPKAGACPACGYDLRAGHDRCPECGRAVDFAALMKDAMRPATRRGDRDGKDPG